MDLSPNQFDAALFPPATRKDGWSPELKARFLALLAEAGNVRLSARRCELSAQSAYVQRRRDALFARGWDAVMVLGRRHAEQVLADRAIEGLEEEIWYRGELVGTRRRYDTRLLLAHLARLDRRIEDAAATEDADRFDEIVALVAGAEPPESLAGDGALPPTRAAHASRAAELAEEEAFDALPPGGTAEERDEAVFDAADAAHARAEAEWMGWFGKVCDTVDRLAGDGAFDPQDSVNVSTSAAPVPPPPGEGDHEVVEGHPRVIPTSRDHPPVPLHHPADGPPPRTGEELFAARTRIVAALTGRSDTAP